MAFDLSVRARELAALRKPELAGERRLARPGARHHGAEGELGPTQQEVEAEPLAKASWRGICRHRWGPGDLPTYGSSSIALAAHFGRNPSPEIDFTSRRSQRQAK
jgi:hypothetical protein